MKKSDVKQKLSGVANCEYTIGERSVLKAGSWASFVSAFLYIVAAVMIAFDPGDIFMGGNQEGMKTIAASPFMDYAWRMVFIILSLIIIFMIRAMSLYLKKNNGRMKPAIDFAEMIMVVASIIATLNWMHFIQVLISISRRYRSGSSLEQIFSIPIYAIDPFYFWTWGMFGLGFIIFGIVGLTSKKMTPVMGAFSILAGAQSSSLVWLHESELVITIGGVHFSAMILCAGLLSVIVAPAFLIMSARLLKKESGAVYESLPNMTAEVSVNALEGTKEIKAEDEKKQTSDTAKV